MICRTSSAALLAGASLRTVDPLIMASAYATRCDVRPEHPFGFGRSVDHHDVIGRAEAPEFAL